jgi:hypothetical protein
LTTPWAVKGKANSAAMSGRMNRRMGQSPLGFPWDLAGTHWGSVGRRSRHTGAQNPSAILGDFCRGDKPGARRAEGGAPTTSRVGAAAQDTSKIRL